MLSKLNKKLEPVLSQIGIAKLFLILFFIFGSIIFGVFALSRYKTIYSILYMERIDKLRYMADFALEVLKDEEYYVKHHIISLNDAKAETIGILKDVRFAHNDYIWIADYNGKLIYHPDKKFIGSNLKLYKDSKGYNFGYDLVEIPKQKGTAYIHYYWPKPNMDSSIQYPKVSYVVAFKDWKWVVGTGIYIDDIKMKVLTAMYNDSFPVLTASLIILLIFSYIIWAAIISPINELANKSLRLANNDLDVIISKGNSKTELGKLYNASNKFAEFFKENINNERKLSLILSNISDVLITTDEKGLIQAVNPVVEKIFGYLPQELKGMNFDVLISPSMFSEPEVFDEFKHSNGKYQMLGIKKDEAFFPVELTINRIQYKDENLFIILIRDITEQKEIEKMKSEFVSIVSHELRTPLTSIRGSLGLALSGAFPAVTGKIKDLLDIAHNNSLRLIALINDILDIEKIEAGKMEFVYEDINVAEVVENALAMNKPYADKFNVKYNLVNNLDKDTFIYVDKNRFIQVLTNLLSNAIKFSPENEAVTISVNRKNDFAQISIADKGIGVPDEFKSKMFDKFTQADSSDRRQKGGTGLGLSISKNIVEEMKGNIHFDSQFGKGTTFYIEFPIM